MAPVAITPDELGDHWQHTRLNATLEVYRGEERFGAVPGNEMGESFAELVAHAARTRELCAGTIIGSGTVSHSSYRQAGSCCIAERRAIEMIDGVEALTGYLQFEEVVRMQAVSAKDDLPLFGVMQQRVVRA
jgi:fumarylacetoacetate (FAA) hydrolase